MDDAVESQPGGRTGKDNRAEFLPVNDRQWSSDRAIYRVASSESLHRTPYDPPGGGRAVFEQLPADAVGVN